MLALYQTCSNVGAIGVSLGSLEGKLSFQNLVSVPVREEDAVWEITLMYHESAKKHKPVREFIEYLRESLM